MTQNQFGIGPEFHEAHAEAHAGPEGAAAFAEARTNRAQQFLARYPEGRRLVRRRYRLENPGLRESLRGVRSSLRQVQMTRGQRIDWATRMAERYAYGRGMHPMQALGSQEFWLWLGQKSNMLERRPYYRVRQTRGERPRGLPRNAYMSAETRGQDWARYRLRSIESRRQTNYPGSRGRHVIGLEGEEAVQNFRLKVASIEQEWSAPRYERMKAIMELLGKIDGARARIELGMGQYYMEKWHTMSADEQGRTLTKFENNARRAGVSVADLTPIHKKYMDRIGGRVLSDHNTRLS